MMPPTLNDYQTLHGMDVKFGFPLGFRDDGLNEWTELFVTQMGTRSQSHLLKSAERTKLGRERKGKDGVIVILYEGGSGLTKSV